MQLTCKCCLYADYSLTCHPNYILGVLLMELTYILIINSQRSVCKIGIFCIKNNRLEIIWVTIISFFVNQSIAVLLSDSNMLINLETISPQADRVSSSSAKLCKRGYINKKNKSLIESLNKIGLSVEPCGTPEIISL